MTVRYVRCPTRPCQQQQNALNVLNSMMNDRIIYVHEVDRNGFVTSLEIHRTKFSVLPEEFSGRMFPELNTFSLQGCRNLTDVSSIGSMRKLRELRLWRCPVLRGFPEELCEGLQKLQLEHCSAFDYALSLRKLQGLEEFRFQDRNLEKVPLVIWSLSNLKRLNLFGYCFTAIPKDIGNLTRLEELRVTGKNVSSISREIRALVHLKNIRFCSEEITELPDELGELTGLERLDLSQCKNLRRIPTPVLQLPHLEYLNLNYCDGLTIPTTDMLKCTDALVEVECEGGDEATYSDDMKRWRELLRHMALLNKNGRYLLKEEDVSLALWGSAMYHWSKNVDCLFYFLKQKPDVIPASSRKEKLAT